MEKIDVGTLNLTLEHKAKVLEALNSNRLSYGPLTDEFEKRVASLHKNKYGVFTNSGTSALQVAIHALKILHDWKDGDEILIPAVTFVATYNVVLQNNLKPVLVDVSLDNLNMDVGLIEDKITERTRAIMPVHLLGKPADMKGIMRIAKDYGLNVIEDSCETLFMQGVGQGDVTCFSFYVAHLLVTGVGGMACTNDPELAELMRSLIFHGRDHSYLKIEDDDAVKGEELKKVIEARFRFNYPGYSYRGTEMEAALGLVELEHYPEMLQKRQRNAYYLNEKLNMWPSEYFDNHALMMFPIMEINRDKLMLHLENKGITTRTIMPLTNQPYIKKTLKEDYLNADAINKIGLLVGCHQDLTTQDLDYMVKCIKEFYDKTG